MRNGTYITHAMLTTTTSLYVAPYKSGSPVLPIHLACYRDGTGAEISGWKYRYNEVSISIDTLGRVIDKYRYFPIHENSEKIWGNFEKILEENGKFLKYVISGTF